MRLPVAPTPQGGVGACRAKQAAEKPRGVVILRNCRRPRISHCAENTQSEILPALRKVAQNDRRNFGVLFPFLLSPPCRFLARCRNSGVLFFPIDISLSPCACSGNERNSPSLISPSWRSLQPSAGTAPYESHPKCNREVVRRPARPVAGKFPDLSNLAGG